MTFYCLCEAKNAKPDSQHFLAPNRYCAVTDDDQSFPPVALRRAMVVVAVGVHQVVLDEKDDKPNDWSGGKRPVGRRHYPNVDVLVLECPNCHARVVRDG